MYSLEILLAVGFGAAFIGLVAGYFISKLLSPTEQSKKQMQNELKELQEKQESYQQEVSEHFVETANLLNQMTDSYRDVHNHLAKGAQLLAADNSGNALKSLSDESSSNSEHIIDEDTSVSSDDGTAENPETLTDDVDSTTTPETESTKTSEEVK